MLTTEALHELVLACFCVECILAGYYRRAETVAQMNLYVMHHMHLLLRFSTRLFYVTIEAPVSFDEVHRKRLDAYVRMVLGEGVKLLHRRPLVRFNVVLSRYVLSY